MLPAHDAETGEIVESTASPSAAPAAPPVDRPLQDGAADDVPTAEQYIADWNAIMQNATSSDLLKRTWNDQTELRKQITWPEGEFVTLQRRVKKAIDWLKEPAQS